MCCTWLTENAGRKNDEKNRHLGTIVQLCRAISLQLRHVSTIGRKLVKQQYLLHMSPQYGELQPTSGWNHFGSMGHPSYFQRLPHLGSVTARHLVVGVSQTLQRWTRTKQNLRSHRTQTEPNLVSSNPELVSLGTLLKIIVMVRKTFIRPLSIYLLSCLFNEGVIRIGVEFSTRILCMELMDSIAAA